MCLCRLMTFCIGVIVTEIFYAKSTENSLSSALLFWHHGPLAGCIKALHSAHAAASTGSGIRGGRSVLVDSRTDLRTDCGFNFATGFCIHCGRHGDDSNFSSLVM